MRIITKKVKKGDYYADLADLPGTPPAGRGKSRAEAVANLFFQILQPKQHPSLGDRERFLSQIDFGGLEVVKDE